MTRGKELAKNTMIIIIGKVSTQFISFFLIPIYTIYLDTSDYGSVDLINTYINLLIPVITLQIEQAVFRFLIDAREDKNLKTIIITSAFKKIIIHAITYFVVFLIISPFINLNYKYFLVSNVILCMFSSIALQIARGVGETKTYTYGSMITGLVAVILNVIFISIFKMNAASILIANLIANIICLIYLFLKLKLYKYLNIKIKSNNEITKEMYKYSLPLIPNSISWWVINVSDRTIVSYVLGLAVNGIYAIASKFSSIYIVVYNLFNLSWTESVSLHINDDDSKEFLTNMINRVFLIFSTICIMIISVLPLIFDIVVKGEYGEAYKYMPILLVASLFNVIVGLYSAIYIAKKETKELAKSSALVAIINIIVNILFIKKIGLYAAALSTLISYIVLMLIRYFDVKKYIDIKLNIKNIIYIVIGITISILVYYLGNVYCVVGNVILMSILSIIINKEFLKDLRQGVKDILF